MARKNEKISHIQAYEALQEILKGNDSATSHAQRLGVNNKTLITRMKAIDPEAYKRYTDSLKNTNTDAIAEDLKLAPKPSSSRGQKRQEEALQWLKANAHLIDATDDRFFSERQMRNQTIKESRYQDVVDHCLTSDRKIA